MWNWYQEHSTTSEVTPGIKKILDDELAQNIGYQPTLQVLQGIRDLFSTSFLSDPRLSRVLPSNLIDWYRSPEGQWFRAVVAQDVELPANATPSEIQPAIYEGIDPVIDRGKHAASYVISRYGRILFATDTPSAPTYANPPGLNGWLEMHRLIDAGETPAQIFKSPTLTNARALKLDRDIGTVVHAIAWRSSDRRSRALPCASPTIVLSYVKRPGAHVARLTFPLPMLRSYVDP